jgi:hypothetical protein
MKVEKTNRGFEIIYFKDRYDMACSLQQSSAIDDTERGFENPGSSFIWLGSSERMHLDRETVTELIKHLKKWVETGKF